MRRWPRPVSLKPKSAGGFRRRLRKLVRGSSGLGELLYTFPGRAFVLAAGGRPHAARVQAVRLVKEGQPLSEVAAAVDVPLWHRRLPPEAFLLPFGSIPGSEEFGRRIVNEIPNKPEATAMWLRWVLFAAESCDESFTLWLAGQNIYQAGDAGRQPLLPLAAFAWFSREDRGPARGLISSPWHRSMSFGLAVAEMRTWIERIILDYCRGGGSRNGNWFKTRKVCGYRIMPLLTADELREEGDRMNNCVAAYLPKIASGACLIYSIRRGGQHVATMEIAPGQSAPVIVQLLAAGNTKGRRRCLAGGERLAVEAGRISRGGGRSHRSGAGHCQPLGSDLAALLGSEASVQGLSLRAQHAHARQSAAGYEHAGAAGEMTLRFHPD